MSWLHSEAGIDFFKDEVYLRGSDNYFSGSEYCLTCGVKLYSYVSRNDGYCKPCSRLRPNSSSEYWKVRILERALRGDSYASIAKKFGVSRGFVRRAIEKAGYKRVVRLEKIE